MAFKLDSYSGFLLILITFMMLGNLSAWQQTIYYDSLSFQESSDEISHQIVPSSERNVQTRDFSMTKNTLPKLKQASNELVPTMQNSTQVHSNTNARSLSEIKANQLACDKTGNVTINLWENSLAQICGTLAGQNGDPWENSQIEFRRFGYATIVTQTDSSGFYTFSVVHSLNDLGQYNYSIYFEQLDNSELGLPPGIPVARPSRELKFGWIIIREQVEVVIEPFNAANNKLPINENYGYVVTLSFVSTGELFNHEQNLQNVSPEYSKLDKLNISFDEIYMIENEVSSPSDISTELHLKNQNLKQSSFTLNTNSGEHQVPVTIDFHVQIGKKSPYEPYIDLPTNPIILAPQLLIEQNYLFLVDFQVDDWILTVANQSSRSFDRENTPVNISGRLYNPQVSPLLLTNVDVKITYLYSPQTGSEIIDLITLKTSSSGEFYYDSFSLNKTFLPLVTVPLQFFVTLDPDNTKDYLQQSLTQQEKMHSVNIKLRANINKLVVHPLKNTTEIYHWKGDTLVVSGNVSYEEGKAASNVKLDVIVVGQNTQVSISTLTQSNGNFEVGISDAQLNSLNQSIDAFFVNVTVINPQTNSSNFYSPNQLSKKSELINVIFDIFLNVEDYVTDSSLQDSTVSNAFFNSTFMKFVSNPNAHWGINLTDSTKTRLPAGYFLQLSESLINGSNEVLINTYAISLLTTNTSTNFNVSLHDYATLHKNTTNFNFFGIGFKYTFSITRDFGVILSSQYVYQKIYTIWGPDNEVPEFNITSLAITGDETTGYNKTITVSIHENTQLDNIKNVTLRWRYSDNNFVQNSSDAIFTSEFQTELLNHTSRELSFTFPYRAIDDHGRWVEFQLTIFDYAGRGVYQNGTTAPAPGLGFPDPLQSLHSMYMANDLVSIRDLDAPRINGNNLNDNSTLANDVFLCINILQCQKTSDTSNVVPFQANITLEVSTFEDLSGVKYAQVISRTRMIDLNTGLNITGWSEVILNMTLSQGIYQARLNASLLTYEYETDFKFRVADFVGNIAESYFVSNALNFTLRVVDITLPEVQQIIYGSSDKNDITIRPGFNNMPPTYNVKHNENITFLFTLQDIQGSGIINYTILYTYTNTSGQILNFLYSESFSTAVEILTLNLTLPIQYRVNDIIEWTAIVYDRAGNKLTANQANPLRILIIDGTLTSSTNSTMTTSQPLQIQDSLNSLIPFVIIVAFVIGMLVLFLGLKRKVIVAYFKNYRKKRTIVRSIHEQIAKLAKFEENQDYIGAIFFAWKILVAIGVSLYNLPRKDSDTNTEHIQQLSKKAPAMAFQFSVLRDKLDKAKYSTIIPDKEDYMEIINTFKQIADYVKDVELIEDDPDN